MIVTIPRLIMFVCISFGAFVALLLGLVRFLRPKQTGENVFAAFLLVANSIWMFIGALEYVGLSVYFPFDIYRIQLPLFTSGVLLPYFLFARLYNPFFTFRPHHIILLLNPAATILICLFFNDDFFFSYKIMGLSLITTAAVPTLLISVVLYTSALQFLILLVVLFVRIIRLLKYGSSFSKKFLKVSAFLFSSTILAAIFWFVDRLLSLGFLPYFYLYAAVLFCTIFVAGSNVQMHDKAQIS
ncbi:MAG TPA: hypothetical protein PLU33_04045 [Treponemataceae bacterium]|nr:hypothetical protein [Treponemataceae bacterium]